MVASQSAITETSWTGELDRETESADSHFWWMPRLKLTQQTHIEYAATCMSFRYSCYIESVKDRKWVFPNATLQVSSHALDRIKVILIKGCTKRALQIWQCKKWQSTSPVHQSHACSPVSVYYNVQWIVCSQCCSRHDDSAITKIDQVCMLRYIIAFVYVQLRTCKKLLYTNVHNKQLEHKQLGHKKHPALR